MKSVLDLLERICGLVFYGYPYPYYFMRKLAHSVALLQSGVEQLQGVMDMESAEHSPEWLYTQFSAAQAT